MRNTTTSTSTSTPPRPLSSLHLDPDDLQDLTQSAELFLELRDGEKFTRTLLEDNPETLEPGIKSRILAYMDLAGATSIQLTPTTSIRVQPGCRYTISREKLILAGVEVDVVDACTEVSEFRSLVVERREEGRGRGRERSRGARGRGEW